MSTGLRIKSVESNGNLYFTTTDGIKKIGGTLSSCTTNFVSTSGFIDNAGGPKALDTTGVVTYECGGFLASLSKTAYRVVWGITDVNKNLILGSPSSRFVIANTDCASLSNVCISFTIPDDANSTCYFYQLYRTGIVTTPCSCLVPCLEPGDEMNLVFEAALTSCDITAGTITVKDTSPDCFRKSGVLLYTNPVSGDGILQANEKPPVAKDVALFRNAVFYSNTSTVQREQFTFLSVSGLTSNKSRFITGNSTEAREYTFVGSKEISTITAKSEVCTPCGSYILLNSPSNEKKFFFWFHTGACATEPCATDTSGRIAVKVLVANCDTAATMACKLQTQITAQSDFVATVCSTVVTVTNDKNGNATDVTNGLTSPTYTFCVTTQGLGEQANTSTSSSTIPAACVTPACCSFTEAAHGFCTGVRGQFSTTCSDLPSGLSVNTDYFVIKCSACVFKVATSRVNALSGTTVAIADAGTGTHTFSSRGGDVLLSSLTSIGQSIDETARSLVNIINRDGCGIVNAFYLSGEDDLPGVILLEGKNLSDTEFYIAVEDDCANITAQFNPKLDRTFSIASMAGICSCAKIRVTTCSAHGLVANDFAYIYDTSNSVLGKFTISAVPCSTNFDITEAFTATSVGRVFETNQVSDNEVKPNRLFFSKSNRPEAVPLVNFIDVGGRDDSIERIVALRDNLFVMKEDGVYIVTGSEGNFTVRLLDNSTFILAPDSAAVLNNQIYMLSSQGVATVSDTGIGVVSRPIEDKILEISNNRFNFKTAAYGLGYESDRSYILWLPVSTSDTTAMQAYRFNTFNRSWVRWTIPSRAGVINPVDDKLYISSGDSSFIKRERKNDDRTDFADCQFNICIAAQCICVCVAKIELSSVSCVKLGDALVQSQFVSIAKFNRFLRKLDLDVGLTCNDYLTGLELKIGQCSGASLVALHTKLDADDCTVCYTAPSAAPSTFATIRTDFNVLAGEINCCSTKTQFHNYATIGACCSVDFESLVTGICVSFNTVCLSFIVPYISGAMVQYRGICSVIDWAPQHFGDASMVKQVPEGTIIFDGNNFFNASVAYSTDLSKDFEERKFFGQGTGTWGGFVYGDAAWGGEGTDVPYRTLIPRQKQRCRYITVRFKHNNAREDFTILGVSLEARPISTRGYRGIK